MREQKQVWLTCQAPSDLALAARKAAAAENISRSEFVRRALEAYLSQDKQKGSKNGN